MTHPDFAKAAAHISADRLRDILMDLVNIASPTGNEIGVARYLVERMRNAGMETDLPLVEESRPNAVGTCGTWRRAQSPVHRPYGHVVFRR